MNALQVYRDDGPLVSWIVRKFARARSGRESARRLAWMVPPLVRLFDYGFVIVLTRLAEPDAMPLCLAFLAVVALHHCDTIYRLNLQGREPSLFVRNLGGGWDGRILVASVLALAGVLGPGLLLAAVGLGVFYTTESVLSWVWFARRASPTLPGDAVDQLE